MTEQPKKKEAVADNVLKINKGEFGVIEQEDYLRVDRLCKGLLLCFYDHLLAEGIPPEEATSLASGADLFVRDFLVDCKSYNLFDEKPGIVKQFAGNWYIVNTLEPDIGQLSRHLLGIRAFYGYLCDQKLITAGYLAILDKECGMHSYYEWRIDAFWKIEGDGFTDWERGCSLKDPLATPARA